MRTAIDHLGEPWFCAKDICEVLGIQNASDAVSTLDEDERSGLDITDPHGRVQRTNFVSLPGLYMLIFTSRKPEAKKFKRWLAHEVVPAIRKQGFYGVIPLKENIACSKQIVVLAEKLAAANDGMVYSVLEAQIRNLSNLLKEPIPDLALIGTDPKQLRLLD